MAGPKSGILPASPRGNLPRLFSPSRHRFSNESMVSAHPPLPTPLYSHHQSAIPQQVWSPLDLSTADVHAVILYLDFSSSTITIGSCCGRRLPATESRYNL